MPDLGDHVACILIGAVVIFQLEGVSGYQPPAVARGRYGHVAGLLLLHADFGDRIALIFGGVEPGIVKEFQSVDWRTTPPRWDRWPASWSMES